MINRRKFVGLALAMPFAGLVNGKPKENDIVRLLSCRSTYDQQHYFSITNLAGDLLVNLSLPARGHDICVNTVLSKAAIVARRPGDFVFIYDLNHLTVLKKISAVKLRHFNGHAIFVDNDTKLLCSENAYDVGEGVIGIYDVKDNYKRIGEFPSFGLDPHEIRLLSDNKTLVIANGGILTHPDLPRIKQNIDSMRPNLAYVDINSGKLIRRLEPQEDWHQLSIRHIDIAADDSVVIAMQYEGAPQLFPPLIAIQKENQALQMLSAPDNVQRRLRNYCGSISFNADQSRFAVSSPRGGVVTLWSRSGDYLGLYEQADACGISGVGLGQADFIISDGGGHLSQLDQQMSRLSSVMLPDTRWDNHMLAIQGGS